MVNADHLVPAGADHTVVTADGARLAVTVCGPPDGPTVVLAHCWTGAREMWAPVAHRLVADGHRVVLYDQRGHGSSTVGSAGCTIEAIGDDLGAVLAHVDGRDAVVAGHSMGGMAAQSYLARHRDDAAARVARVMLVATSPGGLGRGRVANAATARAVGSPRVERLLRARRGHALVRGAFGRGARPADVVLSRDLFVACPPEVRVAFLRAMLGMDLHGALAGFDGGVTVVVGTRDRLTPRRHARALAVGRAGVGVETVVLDGRGHQLPLEAAEDLWRTLGTAAREVAASQRHGRRAG